jgi:pimeloyl-ACP methyl ester carboxylesterase
MARIEPRKRRLPLGAVTLALVEWGDPDAPDVVLCAHGLTRNSRDFDFLARALADRRRVVAFDFAGRGDSDWLQEPGLYGYPTYFEHAVRLIDALELPAFDWIGTSMGGILGMMVAGRLKDRVRRLVLNDVGALVTRQSLRRILQFPTLGREFTDLAEAVRFYREALASWGTLSDEAYRHLAEHSLRRLPNGRLGPSYDPAIRTALLGSDAADINLWAIWGAVSQPVLILRGAMSDLLLRCTALGMVARGGVDFVEIPDAGHAPALMREEEIRLIVDWLDRTPLPSPVAGIGIDAGQAIAAAKRGAA